ncbi:MAG: hypothetical protein EOP19_04905, partial [Hyphomicrobiales bacterium]
MAEKKKGFFQRLFGGGDAKPAPAPEHSVEEDLDADIVLDEVVEAAPLVLPPDQELALAEALHDEGKLITPEAAPAEPVETPPAEPEHSVAEDLEADIILDEVVEAAPLVLPPDQELALAAALHDEGRTISPEPPATEPPPGPPEATTAYIERVDVPATVAPEAPTKKPNWFQRLTTGLRRSSDQLTTSITSVFTKKKLDAEMLEDLEDILIQSDFGLEMASQVTGALRRDRVDRDI